MAASDVSAPYLRSSAALSEPSRQFVSCDHPEFPVIFVMAGNGHFRPFVGWGSRACQLHPRSRALKKLAMN